MIDYEMLRIIWWLLLGVLLIGFSVTDGFDLGVAALFPFLGKNDEERRAFLETIEPVWDGNQVWFVLGGGAIFAAWPPLYAASFSGFYIAMFLVLVTLILRPVGFIFRNQLTNPHWRRTWDWALFSGGIVPGLVFGVAFGNLFLGVPFHYDGMLRFFYEGGFFGLLTPFPLLCGLVSLAMLLMHGATYAAAKTGEPMLGRSVRAAQVAALALIALFSVAGLVLILFIDGYAIQGAIATDGPSNPLNKSVAIESGAWLANYARYPWMIAAPVLGYLGAAGVLGWVRRRQGLALVSSGLSVAGIILTAGFSLFPFLLPSSSQPDASLTVWDASSSQLTLMIMLVATLIFMPLILAYTAWVFRVLRGRITLEHIRSGGSGY